MNPKEMRGIELIGHGGPEMLVWNEAIIRLTESNGSNVSGKEV